MLLIIGFVIVGVILYIVNSRAKVRGAAKVAAAVDEAAKKAGFTPEEAPTEETPTMPSNNVYVQAARDIGAGALESARLATDNARQVVSQVQKDAKINKLQMLLEDEELMAALKSRK